MLSVERIHSQGVLKDCRKSSLFPAASGGYIDGEKFRYREWTPALRAAEVEHRRVYDCRHTFASWALRDDVGLFLLSRIMGTSIQQLDVTHGHLLGDSEDYIRGLLDAGDAVRGLTVDQAAARIRNFPQGGYADERT